MNSVGSWGPPALKLLFVCGLLVVVPLLVLLPTVLPFDLLLAYGVVLPLIAATIYVTKIVIFDEVKPRSMTRAAVAFYVCLYAGGIVSSSIAICIALSMDGTALKDHTVKAVQDLKYISDRRYDQQYGATRLYRDLFALKFSRLFKLGNQHQILDFTVTEFQPGECHFLFNEIFARECYYFESASESPLIIDCGSNIGMSVLYFKHLYPECRIIAFEPDRRTFEVLKKNVDSNGLSNVRLVEKALSDSEGSIRFAKADITLLSSSFRKTNQEWVEVPATRLSSYIEGDVDFVKIDVEGAEGPIIRDLAANGKLASIRQMIVEFHHHTETQDLGLSEFLQILESHGFDFQLSAPYESPLTKDSLQAILIYAYRK